MDDFLSFNTEGSRGVSGRQNGFVERRVCVPACALLKCAVS